MASLDAGDCVPTDAGEAERPRGEAVGRDAPPLDGDGDGDWDADLRCESRRARLRRLGLARLRYEGDRGGLSLSFLKL